MANRILSCSNAVKVTTKREAIHNERETNRLAFTVCLMEFTSSIIESEEENEEEVLMAKGREVNELTNTFFNQE